MPVYKQLIHAVITRVYDNQNKEYHFLRNDTKIIFGQGKQLLGTVIMSNPGSFDFKYDKKWDDFKKGVGYSDTFKSTLGRPDPTMINIIKAIETAYEKIAKDVPDGYVRIYNLSSVRCPNGKKALGEHKRVKEILISNNMDITLLEDPVVYDNIRFNDICKQSIWIVLGLIKGFLPTVSDKLTGWIDANYKAKKITAHSLTNQHPYHPIVWIKINHGKPFNDIVCCLKEVI